MRKRRAATAEPRILTESARRARAYSSVYPGRCKANVWRVALFSRGCGSREDGEGAPNSVFKPRLMVARCSTSPLRDGFVGIHTSCLELLRFFPSRLSELKPFDAQLKNAEQRRRAQESRALQTSRR